MSKEFKIGRSAFLYLEPDEKSHGNHKEFAQCATCPLWTGKDHLTCVIHGKKLEVLGTDTCALYVNGKPMPEMAGKEKPYVTTEESGFEKRQVRCENCLYFQPVGGLCKLFFMLDSEFPDDFELGSKVAALGCCNANIPKEFKKGERKRDAILRYVGKKLNEKVKLKDLF